MKNELKRKVLSYVVKKKNFTVSEFQTEFSLNNYNTKKIVDDLVKSKAIQLETGMTYRCIIEEMSKVKIDDSDNTMDDQMTKQELSQESLGSSHAEMKLEEKGINNTDCDEGDNLEMATFDNDKDAISKNKMGSVVNLTEKIAHNANVIEETLAKFNIFVKVCKVTKGAAVSRYNIKFVNNATIGDVKRHEHDLIIALELYKGIRIYEDCNTDTVALEIPNHLFEMVSLSSIRSSTDYLRKEKDSMKFIIGKDIDGRTVCQDVDVMRHLLIGGSTGSGKSMFLNTMITSLIEKYSPKELRIILIDPKMVEFTSYSGIPHLLTGKIINDMESATNALNWAYEEMKRRYDLFHKKNNEKKPVYNIKEYNLSVENEERLPRIIVIIDECADLTYSFKHDFEMSMQRLAQLSCPAGIHLVFATQNVTRGVTDIIKMNMATRIAFMTLNEKESQVLLGERGAEKLIGHGDMLYKADFEYACTRIQSVYITNEEVASIVSFVKGKFEAQFDNSAKQYIESFISD